MDSHLISRRTKLSNRTRTSNCLLYFENNISLNKTTPYVPAGLPESTLPIKCPDFPFSACKLNPYPSKFERLTIWHKIVLLEFDLSVFMLECLKTLVEVSRQ